MTTFFNSAEKNEAILGVGGGFVENTVSRIGALDAVGLKTREVVGLIPVARCWPFLYLLLAFSSLINN